MPVKICETKDDFYRCNLTNCNISNTGEVTIDDTTQTGEIISPVYDLTDRLFKIGSLAYSITSDSNSDYTVYYRVYSNNQWNDWVDCTNTIKYMQYTLSLTPDNIAVEYDIQSIENIYTEEDYRYNLLWQAITDKGYVNYARVDYDPSSITDYAANAHFKDNYIFLSDKLNKNNASVMVVYIPQNYVITDISRYVQWKIVLNSLDDVSSPMVNDVSISYRLDFSHNISDQFPLFYRRL